jgi:MoxR-like ATPase
MAKPISQLKYTGKKRPQAGELDPKTGEKLYPYLPGKELIDAVNLAIFLERPLLLEGEPGGGKTELARAVAYDLDLDYYYYCVKSTSKAQDLLYQFDIIGRLRDAQLAATHQFNAEEIEKIRDPKEYRELGVLGKAFRSRKPSVILIDEIDKADIDFPNDLLQELEKRRFYIKETNEHIPYKTKPGTIPLIFITSNAERKLPDAFLRRCLYQYVSFPEKERLEAIIKERFAETDTDLKLTTAQLETALQWFIELRQAMTEDEERESTKQISTSEWIDWITAIRANPAKFQTELDNGNIPFPEVLLKSEYDRKTFLNLPQQLSSEAELDDELDLDLDDDDWN